MRLKTLTLGLLSLVLTANISNAAFPVNATNPVAIELSSNAPAQNHAAEVEVLKNTKAPIIKNSQPSRGKSQRGGGFAIASLVCGIVGLFIAGIPLGIVAVIFGALGLAPDRPLKGLAIAGLVLGVISIIGALIYLATM